MTPKDDYFGKFYLKQGKKEDQDFKIVDVQVWNRLYGKYGGKEVRRHSIAVPTDNPTRPDYVVEVELRHFRIVTWPRVKYFPTVLEQEIYCSRSDTIKEFLYRICHTSEFESAARSRVAEELAQNCRVWKLEGDETFQDIRDSLEERKEKVPIAVSGRVLESYLTIADANIADNEVLVLEWRIALDKDAETPFAYDPKPNARKNRFQRESRLPEDLQAIKD